MGNEVKIGKSMWLQMELLVPAISVMITVVVLGTNLRNDMSNMQDRMGKLEGVYNKIDAKLDAIIEAQAIDKRVDAIRMSDRWTGSMQVEFQEVWVELMKDLHPEVVRRDAIPDIREIQMKHPIN